MDVRILQVPLHPSDSYNHYLELFMAKPGHDKRKQATDRRLDQTIDDSFPASDPPSHSGITGVGNRDAEKPGGDSGQPLRRRGQDERPTGLPTSDRYETETAHVREDDQEQ
jgi:hypothetical protein